MVKKHVKPEANLDKNHGNCGVEMFIHLWFQETCKTWIFATRPERKRDFKGGRNLNIRWKNDENPCKFHT